MKRFDIKEIAPFQLYKLLTTSVIPRPIAFASTINDSGQVNLSPFSYFNIFSSNPPILVFSPVRRSADGGAKDTYENLCQVKEVVINMVNYNMVHQMNLASGAYEYGINEFKKSGLTEEPSVRVRPPRVKESPVSFECLLTDMVELGKEGGAGTLMICEIVYVHLAEEVLDGQGLVDPFKLDAVARLGGSLYARVTPETIFEIPKNASATGIGVDALPDPIRLSKDLNGAELAMLGSLPSFPVKEDIDRYPHLKSFIERTPTSPEQVLEEAKRLLEDSNIVEAAVLLLHLG